MTGHAEVVQVRFDPSLLSYRDLLGVFFAIHDPTTLNRQGADVGTQYRSAVFYHDDEQKQAAEELIKELNLLQLWERPLSLRWRALRSSSPRRTIISSTSPTIPTSHTARL